MASMKFDRQTAQTLMSLIEDNKEKITENEYVKLCNASKFVYENSEMINTTTPQPSIIRNPFWRGDSNWGLNFVPMRNELIFTPTVENMEIRKLETEIKTIKEKELKNNREYVKRHRVLISDKMNVLMKIIIEQEITIRIPYNIKTMTDKVMYLESKISELVELVELKHKYKQEMNERVQCMRDQLKQENDELKKKRIEHEQRLAEIRN